MINLIKEQFDEHLQTIKACENIPAEVEKIYFFDKKELIKLLESHEITDCAKTIIEKYFLELL